MTDAAAPRRAACRSFSLDDLRLKRGPVEVDVDGMSSQCCKAAPT